jgi:hypothetical protein
VGVEGAEAVGEADTSLGLIDDAEHPAVKARAATIVATMWSTRTHGRRCGDAESFHLIPTRLIAQASAISAKARL